MASKTLPDGRRVLVGSKADPDSDRYTPRSTSRTTSTPDTPDTSLYAQPGEDYAAYQARVGSGATPTPETPSPAATTSPYFPRYTQENTAPKVKSMDDIQADLMKSAQVEINSLRDYERTLLEEQSQINATNDRSTQSVNTLTGLAGSSEANVQQQKTTQQGQKANQAIQSEIQMRISSILGGVSKAALEEARAQRQEARLDEAARMELRAARQQEAVTNLQNLAAAGVTPDGLKSTDPRSYQYLADAFGGEDALKGAFVLNTPQDQILDKRVEGGRYVIAKQNPITGKVTVETVDLGLPVGFSKTVDAGDRILAIPDNWSGDPSELVTINKGLTPNQAADAGAVAPSTGIVDANGKPLKLTASQVDSITSFDTTVGAASTALSLLEQGVETGPIANLKLQAQKYADTADPNALKLEQLLGKIKADFFKATSGAAVSEKEVARLSKFLPDFGDQEGVIRQKVATLTEEMQRGKAALIDTLGGSVNKPVEEEVDIAAPDTYVADGVTYVLASDGLYYPQ